MAQRRILRDDYQFPTSLYRYEKVSDDFKWERNLFLEHALHFESPRNFNDPFDSKPHAIFSRDGLLPLQEYIDSFKKYYPGASNELIVKYANEMYLEDSDPATRAQKMARMKAEIQKHFDATTMKCFSENWNSILQWSHYADSHRGYCVEFNLPRDWLYQPRTRAEFGIAVMKVKYQDRCQVLDLDGDFDDPSLIDSLLVKSNHWEYESEWRALRVDSTRGLQPLPPESIKRVIFGSKMTSEGKNEFASFLNARTPTLELWECATAEDKFELIKRPFDANR